MSLEYLDRKSQIFERREVFVGDLAAEGDDIFLITKVFFGMPNEDDALPLRIGGISKLSRETTGNLAKVREAIFETDFFT